MKSQNYVSVRLQLMILYSLENIRLREEKFPFMNLMQSSYRALCLEAPAASNHLILKCDLLLLNLIIIDYIINEI